MKNRVIKRRLVRFIALCFSVVFVIGCFAVPCSAASDDPDEEFGDLSQYSLWVDAYDGNTLKITSPCYYSSNSGGSFYFSSSLSYNRLDLTIDVNNVNLMPLWTYYFSLCTILDASWGQYLTSCTVTFKNPGAAGVSFSKSFDALALKDQGNNIVYGVDSSFEFESASLFDEIDFRSRIGQVIISYTFSNLVSANIYSLTKFSLNDDDSSQSDSDYSPLYGSELISDPFSYSYWADGYDLNTLKISTACTPTRNSYGYTTVYVPNSAWYNRLDLTIDVNNIELQTLSDYYFDFCFTTGASWGQYLTSCVVTFVNPGAGDVRFSKSFDAGPLINQSGYTVYGVDSYIKLKSGSLYSDVERSSRIGQIIFSFIFSKSVDSGVTYTFSQFGLSHTFPQPDDDALDSFLHAWDNIDSIGLDDTAGEYMTQARYSLQGFLSGFQAFSAFINKFTALPYLGALLILSVAIGLFSFMLGMLVHTISRASSGRNGSGKHHNNKSG